MTWVNTKLIKWHKQIAPIGITFIPALRSRKETCSLSFPGYKAFCYALNPSIVTEGTMTPLWWSPQIVLEMKLAYSAVVWIFSSIATGNG
jgi:hypothetical protein